MRVNIEFGLCADELKEQLKEFNLPDEQVAIWQGIADFIITAHIHHAVTDKAQYKLNSLLGSIIVKELKKKYLATDTNVVCKDTEGEG